MARGGAPRDAARAVAGMIGLMCNLLTCTGCGAALTVEDLAARGEAAEGRAAVVLAAVPDEWWWCGECAEGAWFLLAVDVAARRRAAHLDVSPIARGEAA